MNIVVQPEFYFAILPMVVLGVASLFVLLIDARSDGSRKALLRWFAAGSLVAASVALYGQPLGVFFGETVVIDRLAFTAEIIILAIALAVTCLLSIHPVSFQFFRGDLVAAWLLGVLGLLVMVSTRDFLTVFVGLELSSLAFYTLVFRVNQQRKALEAAIKYFVVGGFTAAVFMMGVALFYAATGHLGVGSGRTIASLPFVGQLGVMLLVLAMLAKLAVVPLHAWAPDIYQGASSGITSFLLTAAKVSILIVLLRIFRVLPDVNGVLWLLSLAAGGSMVYGNLLAISQRSLKRVLAYSSISHGGYLVLALLVATKDLERASQLIVFYLVGYAVAALLMFAVIMALETERHQDLTIEDLAGLGHRAPILGGFLVVSLLSLSGFPPTVGFMTKLLLFKESIHSGHWLLVLVAALTSVLGLFYYMRIAASVFLSEGQGALLEPRPLLSTVFMGTMAVIVLALGTVGAPLMLNILSH